LRLAGGFSRETVTAALRHGAPLGRLIEHHVALPRCMGRLAAMMAEYEARGDALPCGTVVVADRLEEGRGRFAREWHAPGGGAWLAVAWSDSLMADQLALLPFAAGVACCETLREYAVDARIKWVNDVHVRGRKIAGILTETLYGPQRGQCMHCLGIGVNVNNAIFPPALRNSAVSLRQLLSRPVNLNRLRLQLLIKLRWNIGLLHFQEARALSLLLDETAEGEEALVLRNWRKLSDTLGRRVEYGFDVQHAPAYRATVLALDGRGGLEMALDDGTRLTEYGGEIRYLD